jgi:putative ABC transport system permease protein
MEGVIQELRHAVRSLSRSAAFSVAALLALGLGIGASTTLFSLVHAVLVRPLPYAEPERLVLLWGNVKRAKVERRGASWADFLDWRREAASVVDMAAYWGENLTLAGDADAERLAGEVVSPAYLGLLGVVPELGRDFRPEEAEGLKAAPVVLISHGLWMRRFGGDPKALGRTLRLDDYRASVVGVLPPGFRGLTDEADVWLPTGVVGDLDPQNRGDRWFTALGRLRPGVSAAQAQERLTEICQRLETQYPRTNEARGVEIVALARELTGDLRAPLIALLGAAALVLLIACANVAGLLLTRAEARQREFAVRAALGASRGRLLRQLVAEGLVLAAGGALLGWVFAYWGIDALVALSPIELPTFMRPRPDLAVGLATAGIAGAIGLAFGVIPAWRGRGTSPALVLQQSSARVEGGAGRQVVRSGLVVAEIALALVLLVGAGLFLGTLQRLFAVDPGFDPRGRLSFRVSLGRLENPDAPPAVSSRLLREKLAALPGVTAASLSSDLPLAGGSGAFFFSVEGQSPGDAQTRPRAYIHRVSPGFFSTLGIRLLKGREFQEGEGDSVAIVSNALAQRFWPNADPIGRRLGPSGEEETWPRIVGVVDDVRYRGLPQNPTPDPDVYVPFRAQARSFAVVLRTSGDEATLRRPVLSMLTGLDPAAVAYDSLPMTERVARQTARARFTAWLASAFSVAALGLACLGLYGVVSYLVARRTREFGVRLALGASPADLRRLVLGRGLLLIGAGTLLGLAGALALFRLLNALLFGVSPFDPATYAAVAAGLVAVSVLALLVPAQRAARTAPVVALRDE